MLIDATERLWMPIPFLEKAGISALKGRRRVIEGVEYIALESLAPDVTAVFDERALAVKLTIAPRLLAVTLLESGDRPANLVFRQNTSLFANYALNVQHEGRYKVRSWRRASARRSGSS